MKHTIFVMFFMILGGFAFAQADTTPVYKRFPTVPVFTLTKLPDSSRFTRDDLSKKKSVVFVIFNPFCDHCKHLITGMTADIGLFEKAQIILASPVEYTYLKKFYEDLKIADHPAIMMGRDPSNYFGTFFKVSSVPAIFVYDKKGNFVKAFDQNAVAKDIAEAL